MTSQQKRRVNIVLLLILGVFTVWLNLLPHAPIRIGAFERDLNVRLGLDLQGGAHLVYRAIMDDVARADVDDALAGVRDVIERRVNAFGVSEPVVQTNEVAGEHRVIVELAGVHDPNEAISLIGATPQLDFRTELPSEEAEEAIAELNADGFDGELGPIYVRSELSGKHLKRSSVTFDPVSGVPQVNLEFNGEGTDLFAELTRENLGNRIAIYLDGVPISAPTVQSEITNGQAVISGGFALDEAKQLSQRLNAGALPIPVELIGQQTVGPTLGKLSVQRSVAAGMIGLIAVMIWMVVFYRLPGVVATVALLLYALVFMTFIKLIGVTLTLAGVAGFILTVGMAVDANVLIFERFRENVRAGKRIQYALEEGFREAWDSIKASNVSSLLTALVLYSFGTSVIRGFAVTFALGVALSMFTAIFVTRTLLVVLLEQKVFQKPLLLAVKPSEERA